MIRSTKVSLKFTNAHKLQQVHNFVDSYTDTMRQCVDILWPMDKLPMFIPKTIWDQIETTLSTRAISCAGKQAIGIVKGTKKKQNSRRFVHDKLVKENKLKNAKKLQRIIENTKESKPIIDTMCPELDSRFVKIDLDNDTSFDGWVTIASIGNRQKIVIPFKRTKHFNKLYAMGTMKLGIRLSKTSITFMFDIPDVPKRTEGRTVGIDIGQTTTITCSNGFTSQKCNHGHDLSSITDKMCRCKKGSKGFKRVEEHRTNYINWTINQVNFDGIKEVRVEDIKYMRKGKRTSRKLGHWAYAAIFGKLNNKCEEKGVPVTRVSPTYTSKRCSKCGWTRSLNRKGKLFRCRSCGNTMDADMNASMNIESTLAPIRYKQRRQFNITKGFWWPVAGDESLVHPVKKPIMNTGS